MFPITYQNGSLEAVEQLRGYRYISRFQDSEKQQADDGGCSCGASCGADCPCSSLYPWGSLYNPDGTLIPVTLGIDIPSTLVECGPACDCRETSHAARTPARVRLCSYTQKGWGVVADECIRAGMFVCEYVGERLTNAQADARLAQYRDRRQPHALLIFREILPSSHACIRISIDATYQGNVAAFINHRLV